MDHGEQLQLAIERRAGRGQLSEDLIGAPAARGHHRGESGGEPGNLRGRRPGGTFSRSRRSGSERFGAIGELLRHEGAGLLDGTAELAEAA